jgi:hypothetical protein
MASPKNSPLDFSRLVLALSRLKRRKKITKNPPLLKSDGEPIDIRTAFFALGETVSLSSSVGRIVKGVAVSCPPAIPVVVCGETLTRERIEALKYYGYEKIEVVSDTDG